MGMGVLEKGVLEGVLNKHLLDREGCFYNQKGVFTPRRLFQMEVTVFKLIKITLKLPSPL